MALSQATYDTTLGTLRVWSTGDGHLAIGTEATYYGTPGAASSVTVNGVAYRCTLHMHRAEDGTDAWEMRDSSDFSATRSEWESYKEMGGTPAGRRKLLGLLTDALREYAGKPEAAALMAQAASGKRQEKRAALAREIDELRGKLAAAEAELAAL